MLKLPSCMPDLSADQALHIAAVAEKVAAGNISGADLYAFDSMH